MSIKNTTFYIELEKGALYGEENFDFQDEINSRNEKNKNTYIMMQKGKQRVQLMHEVDCKHVFGSCVNSHQKEVLYSDSTQSN